MCVLGLFRFMVLKVCVDSCCIFVESLCSSLNVVSLDGEIIGEPLQRNQQQQPQQQGTHNKTNQQTNKPTDKQNLTNKQTPSTPNQSKQQPKTNNPDALSKELKNKDIKERLAVWSFWSVWIVVWIAVWIVVRIVCLFRVSSLWLWVSLFDSKWCES